MARSVIGYHYSLGGNKSGIGLFMDKLAQAGIPFLFKGTDDASLCFIGQTKGNNHLIYRVSTAGQANGIQYDVPDYTKSPLTAATDHFNKTAAKWPIELDRAIVWMEPINEPRAKLNPGDIQWGNMHPADWLGWFMVEYAKIANAAGFKACGPSFNAGEPEVFSTNDYELPGMLAYLKYCADNPEKAALSVHEYTWDKWQQGQSWPDWYPQLWGRAEAAIAAADKHNIPRTFPIFVTEWGFAHNNAPRWPECEPHLTAYNQWAAKWPQVKGVAAWTLASGWGDVDHDLQSWFGQLGDYAVNTTFDPGPQPAATHAVFGGTLPNGDIPMATLDEQLLTASLNEFTIQKTRPGNIRYPLALGNWQQYLGNVRHVPAHNEIGVKVENKDYSIQGFYDPYGKLPYEVIAWNASRGHWVIVEPAADGTPTPDPF